MICAKQYKYMNISERRMSLYRGSVFNVATSSYVPAYIAYRLV